ncbi:MAG: NUDIX domain-containing protein [Candidatus Pacebacteria bacterium]|nr:NUDIX domain-containing protein [Candidatus Paceibacterota bacterium]
MKKGIDHIGITVSYLCFDRAGRLLLGKRGKNARDEHGRWDNGGGAMEFGDSIDVTLHKEIKEEYSADVIESIFLGVHDVFREQNGVLTHWLCVMFKVLLDPDSVVNGEPHKIDEIGWFSLDALPEPLHSDLPNTLKRYKMQISG